MSFHQCDWQAVGPDMDGVTRHLASCLNDSTVVIVADDHCEPSWDTVPGEWFACDDHKEEMSDPDLSGLDVLEVRLLEAPMINR